jgi:DNA-binding PadR family transcriptional regulator
MGVVTNAQIPSPMELQVLALVAEERTGAEVAVSFERETGATIAHGTLYSALRRLRQKGWVRMEARPDPDRRLRYFGITPDGALALSNARGHHSWLAHFGAAGDER